MKSLFDIFKIRKDERWLAIVSVIVFAFLNFMTVNMYWGRFSAISENYHRLFVRWFRISGFDPLTYEVISHWDTAYNGISLRKSMGRSDIPLGHGIQCV